MGVDKGVNLNSFTPRSKARALYNMFMKSWAILGLDMPIVCSKHNIGGMGCNYKFNKKKFSVWCVIEYMHHSKHQHPNYNPYELWG